MRTRRVFYFLATFVVVLAVLLTLSFNAGLFQVNEIPVEVERSLSPGSESAGLPAELQHQIEADLNPFLRHKIWEIPLTQLRATLLSRPWIRSAQVTRMFPNRLRVMLTPKRPVMLYISPQGKILPMMEDGAVLANVDPSLASDAPVLRGEQFDRDINMRKKAIEFYAELPEHGSLSKKNIAEITHTSDQGYSLLLVGSRLEVRMGEDHVGSKAARVAQVLDYLNTNHLRGRVIDASFSKKVLVRLRKDP